MDHPKPFILLVFSLICICALASAQRKSYHTGRIPDNSIRVDGIDTDDSWNQVEWSGNYTQNEPYDSVAPSQNSAFKIIYDNDAIYFLIRSYDTAPDSIVRRMSRRDEFEGDLVEIFIDSYFDRSTAFGFTVNAAGIRSDYIISGDGNDFDATWDPVWYAKTSIDDEGWLAEIKIPFSQLRFANLDDQVWGIQIGRHIFRYQEWSWWRYFSRNASGYVSNFGDLKGIRNIKPRRQTEIMPFVVGGFESYEKEEGNPFQQGRDYIFNAGVDGKVGISNNFILDFTINPDFGQVEADPSEVNLTTYETFFEERRPFFIEGKNLLDFTITDDHSPSSNDVLFYSRRIGKPPSHYPDLGENEYVQMPENTTILGAFKLTGKTSDGWSVAAMNSITQRESALIDREGERRNETVEPLTSYLASRVMKDFNKANSQVGIAFTMVNRSLQDEHLAEFMNRNGYSAGLNFRHQWKNKTYFIDGTFVYSHVNGSMEAITGLQTSRPKYFQRPDADHLSVDSAATNLGGTGSTIRIGKQGNSSWNYAFSLTHRSPALETNDAGFLISGDLIRQVSELSYTQTVPKGIFRSTYLMLIQANGITFGGERKYSELIFFGNTRFMNYWGGGLDASIQAPRLEINELRGGPTVFTPAAFGGHYFISSDHRKRIHAYAGNYLNKSFDGESQSLGFFAGIDLRPFNALQIELEPVFSRSIDKNQYVTNEMDYVEPRYIRSRFDQKEFSLQIRATFNISPDFTLQYYGMPFVSIGKYVDFSYIKDPKAVELRDRLQYYTPDQINYNAVDEEYLVDENDDGLTNYRFDNPDFNVFDFNSNFVVRWEYKAGSVVYLVWTQNRFKWDCNGSAKMDESLKDLFSIYPHNVLMVKFSYRFGI